MQQLKQHFFTNRFPFPSCVDDVRETQDGCNPCDGPKGKPRNRPLETLLGLSPAQPAAKPIFPRRSDLLGKTVPTFAGEQTFGPTLARKERQHGGRPTIRYSYTAPSQSTYFIRHNSNSRQPPQPRKRNLVVATHPEEVVAAAVRRREQAQGRGRPAVAAADPTPTIEEIILDSPPPLAARKTSSPGFSVQSHPEEAVGSRSQGRPAPTAEVRLPQQEQQQQQQQRRRDDLFQSFFGSPLVRNSAQPRQRKEEEEREDSFLPNLRDLAVQRERPSPRRILNLPRDEPSLRLEPHPEEAVAAQEEILPPSIFADEVEEEELPEEGGEVRRVFNPQTGEYVEVVLTKKQLEREEAEKNKNKRPVPIYRGRFRVGPDGKLTAVPLDEIEEEPEIIETGEEVAPSAPEKDSHGPFELFQLGAASAAGRLSDEAFAVYDAAPGTQDELFDEEEEALIRQQQEKKHGLFDVVDLGR